MQTFSSSSSPSSPPNSTRPPRVKRRPPIGLKYRASSWFVTLALTWAVFTDIFLYGVIVPVIPFAMIHRAGVDPDEVQNWVSILMAIYGVALSVFSPICGWLSDHVDARRWPILSGMVALIGATVMLNLGSSITVLIVGRFLQGVAAAVIWSVGFALLVDSVDEKALGQHIGVVIMGQSLGLLSPLLGGVLYQRVGYNAVYAVCYSLIALDLLLRILLVEKKDKQYWLRGTAGCRTGEILLADRLPDQGSVVPHEEGCNNEAISCLSYAGKDKNGPVLIVSSDPAGPRMEGENDFGGPVVSRCKRKQRRLPEFITLLSSQRLLAALFASIIQAMLITSFDAVLPLYVNEIFNWKSLQAGLLYTAIVVPTFVSPAIGWLSDRYGPRWLSAGGFLGGAPLFILLRYVDHDSIGQKILLCTILSLIGLTMALAFAPIVAEISNAVTEKQRLHSSTGDVSSHTGGPYAQAYGLFNVAFAVGSTLGPIWAGLIKKTMGWSVMTWTLGLLSGLTAIPTAIWVGGSIWKRKHVGEV